MSLLNAAMNGDSSGGGTGGGYDAAAYTLIKTAASSGAIDAGWDLANRRGVLGALLFNLNGIVTGATTWAEVALDASTFAAVLADPDQSARLLSNSAALEVIASSGSLINQVIDDASAFGDAFATSDGAQSFKKAIWDSDTACAKLLARASAHDAARAAGSLHFKDQNSTSGADFTTGVTGGNLDGSKKYLVLGVSWDQTFNTTLTLATLRSGSARPASGSWLGSQAAGNDTTAAFDLVTPIEGPTITATAGGGGGNDIYLHVLDCTPPV